MHEPPSHSRTFLNPDPEAAKADQAACPPSPPAQESANPGTADRSRPRSRSTERRRHPRTEGPEPAEIVVALVRAGSARHRNPGPRRAPAVTTGAQEPQVTRPSPLPPGTAKQQRAGFEPLGPRPAGGEVAGPAPCNAVSSRRVLTEMGRQLAPFAPCHPSSTGRGTVSSCSGICSLSEEGQFVSIYQSA